MGKKRGYASEESQLLGEDATQPPVVRSRRERAVKARLREEDEGPSSSPDSGSGDHYDPVNVTEVPRAATGSDLKDDAKEGKPAKSSKRTTSRSGPSRSRRRDVPTKRGPGGIFKTAAIKILTEASCLLSSGAIYDRAMKQGLVSESAGKTPEATMAAALYTDIKKYREQSTFIKPREGLFGLRDWIQEGCDILTPADKAEVNAAQSSSRDSVANLTSTSMSPGKTTEREATPKRRASKPRSTSKRQQGRSKPDPGSRTPKPYMRQTRSHSLPPSDRVELHKAAQPALSGPPEVFGNERLQALFAAVDQVSRSTASASQTASLTESEGDPSGQVSSGGTGRVGSARASVEPDGESAHMPKIKEEEEGEEVQMPLPQATYPQPGPSLAPPASERQLGGNLELGEGSGLQADGMIQGGGLAGAAVPFKPIPLHPPAIGPIGFNPLDPGDANHPHDFSMGESLSPEEQASALAQVDVLERQLASLDQSDKADPTVGNCHMQLSTLYLALGFRDKAIQNYMIALERCEALLT